MARTKKAETAPTSIEVELVAKRETKNTIRFECDNAEEVAAALGVERAPIDTLYVQKAAFGANVPAKITVTVAW